MRHIARHEISLMNFDSVLVGLTVWKDLEQHIIGIAISQCRRRLTVCVCAKGSHFEHRL